MSRTTRFSIRGTARTEPSTPGKPGYAVFGRVIDGMNAVDTIRYIPTARQQMPNMPVETVTIDRMTILTPEEAKSAMEDATKKQAEAPEAPVYPGDDVGDAKRVDAASGLAYYDLVEGDGASPKSAASTVKVHYTGWLTDGTKFDSSVDRGQPIDFPLNAVIPGWTEGVQSMKVGGKPQADHSGRARLRITWCRQRRASECDIDLRRRTARHPGLISG